MCSHSENDNVALALLSAPSERERFPAIFRGPSALLPGVFFDPRQADHLVHIRIHRSSSRSWSVSGLEE
nr:predicted protein [Hordeum vulgare subsp. vulgare]